MLFWFKTHIFLIIVEAETLRSDLTKVKAGIEIQVV